MTEQMTKKIDLLNRDNAMIMRPSPRWLQFFGILMITLGMGMITPPILYELKK